MSLKTVARVLNSFTVIKKKSPNTELGVIRNSRRLLLPKVLARGGKVLVHFLQWLPKTASVNQGIVIKVKPLVIVCTFGAFLSETIWSKLVNVIQILTTRQHLVLNKLKFEGSYVWTRESTQVGTVRELTGILISHRDAKRFGST